MSERIINAFFEAFALLKSYAHEHLLVCFVPALFIAGAISVFVSKESVMKYFGAKANKCFSYGVAPISGSVLSVCSCTILPFIRHV